ncbi:MAG: hypothetical protein UT11_C0028G0013 [Berkelbacteria bacterium GW2011_GWA2_38_9]|uniref:Uncharacterized protein n=1 Tax=Berkelbacteria bacterium GW2011_GWA2_38_9 TaxID=1618334 RepID=A0A0G0LBE5_9BACT|nr:MAG: hypothetical protein UT11_C0028G0013 [Berkelbacteria bacterium GW2011_GWA2_38_9]
MKAWHVGTLAAALLLAAAVAGSADDGGDIFPLIVVFGLSGWAWHGFGNSVRLSKAFSAFCTAIVTGTLGVFALTYFSCQGKTIAGPEMAFFVYAFGAFLAVVAGLEKMEESITSTAEPVTVEVSTN